MSIEAEPPSNGTGSGAFASTATATPPETHSPPHTVSFFPPPRAKRPPAKTSGKTFRFPVGDTTNEFRQRFFPQASRADWNAWRWQIRNRIKSLKELQRIFVLSADETSAVSRHTGSLPVGITPYYASLMNRDDAQDPLRRTHIPVGTAFIKTPGEFDDPLGEDHDAAVPALERDVRHGPQSDSLLGRRPLWLRRERRRCV